MGSLYFRKVVLIMEDAYKEVYFNEYCKTCKHELLADYESPCDECLEDPVNLYSHKPMKWEEKDGHKSV